MRNQPISSLLVLLFYSMYLNVYIFGAYSQCLDDQRILLLQLKDTLTFNPRNSIKLVSWNQSWDCCRWNGVTCNEEGRITGLDLSGEFISGGFDNTSSLFRLQNLEILNLSSNDFNSVIPSGFHKLKNLTSLNLSHASFVGQIPSEISQLTRLVTLDITSLSYLTGKELKLENPNLQRLVQNLTGLRQLYLDGVSISAQGQEWCNALSVLHALQELSMSNCNLSGPIDYSLEKLENLSVMRLDQNNLSSAGPEFFADFKNLTTLHLSSCGLRGIFPPKIFQVATMTSIDISYNSLSGYLPDFPLNGSLKTLIVSNTNLSGQIPNSISNLMQLSQLDLSKCQFAGKLPSSMSKLTELSYLDLSDNSLTGPIPSFNRSRNLTHLNLSYNDLTGGILSAHLEVLRHLVYIDLRHNSFNGNIPSSVFSLPMLQKIQFSNNNFDGQLGEFSALSSSALDTLDLSSNNLKGPIPRSIFNLRKLNILQLSSNNFNGSIELDMFRSLSNLTSLDISYNNLSVDANVTDPHLSSFPNLTYLKLSSCKLREFPLFLRNQSKLAHLDLSNNYIHGGIPQFLCNASSLLVLDLSNNNFDRTIPECLTKRKTLAVLNLQNNRLNGTIPDTFPASCDLKTLDIHNNSLGGMIPKSLANCTMLEVIDFGKNKIMDGFPCLLKNISTLRVLVLRENKFQGKIGCPLSTGTWKNLQIVDLALNNFSGTLPEKCFTSWEAMMTAEHQAVSETKYIRFQVFDYGKVYYQDSVTVTNKGLTMNLVKNLTVLISIDFSSNHFEGRIPEEMMNLKALHVLNLSNNALSGQIPSSIGNLKLLEHLDMSNNSLEGQIPNQLASLSFLSFLSLSFNHLAGQIPTGGQFLTFAATSFIGNEKLCGVPLSEKCSGSFEIPLSNEDPGSLIDWHFISAELGFFFGLGTFIALLLFRKPWRLWYWNLLDNILCHMFPQLYLSMEYNRGKWYSTLRWRR